MSDKLQKLKYKEPTSTKIIQLEQELVRAEAQSLVAEAQLTNITRQKLKEAYLIHTSALIERSEKQALLARHARRVLALLDDTPIVPGEAHPPFEGIEQARHILLEAEEELRAWKPSFDEDGGGGGARRSEGIDRLEFAAENREMSQSATQVELTGTNGETAC